MYLNTRLSRSSFSSWSRWPIWLTVSPLSIWKVTTSTLSACTGAKNAPYTRS